MIPILMDSNISFHLEIYVHRILQNYLRGLPKHSPRQKQREVQITFLVAHRQGGLHCFLHRHICR